MRPRFQEKLRKLLAIDRPPWVLALASALGMLIGISPYFGFHTLLAVSVAFLLRLPAYPLLVGAYITNPFTIPVIYAFTTKVGMLVLGSNVELMTIYTHLDWAHLSWHSLFHTAKLLFWPFFIGTHLVGLALSFFTYFTIYFIVKKYRDNN